MSKNSMKTHKASLRERERVKSLRDFALEFYLPRSACPVGNLLSFGEREVFYYWGTFNNLKRYFYSAFLIAQKYV